MDDRFPDLMNELSSLDVEVLQKRWEIVSSLASSADQSKQARLVLLASKQTLDREADSWFWKPFREAEQAFPVENAVEVHSRLAASCVRDLIPRSPLTAMLVVLGDENGSDFAAADVESEARQSLSPILPQVSSFNTPKAYWTTDKHEEMTSDETPPALTEVATAVDGLGVATNQLLKDLAAQISSLTSWAIDAEARFTTEHLLVQWLIGGLRADGAAWSDLPSGVVAIDAALELAGMIEGAPQRRHEAILAQILAVAGVDGTPVDKAELADVSGSFDEIENRSLATLSPITVSLNTSGELPTPSAADLARRLLWETRTRRFWDAAT